MTLAPQIEGTVPIRSSAAQFVQAFHYRVAAGLLVGQPHPRSNYRVAEAGPGQLRIHARSEEHTSELQSRLHLVCRLLLEKKKKKKATKRKDTEQTTDYHIRKQRR